MPPFFFFSETETTDVLSFVADESLYHALNFSPKNSQTEEAFLNQNRDKMPKGLHVSMVRNVPVLTFFLCGKDASLFKAHEYFFDKKGQPCVRGAQFFPGKNAWELTLPLLLVAHAPFVTLNNHNRYLIYRSDISYEINQTIDGTKAIFHDDGRVTNDLQKPIFPSFVYTPSGWIKTMPVREFFELTVLADNSYQIHLFSDVSLPLDATELADFLDLRTTTTPTVHATVPQLITVTGSDIIGVAIPILKAAKEGEERGVYRINISVPKMEFRCQHPLSFSGGSCSCTAQTGSFSVECTVTASHLNSSALKPLRSWLKQIVPPFIVVKKGTK